MLEFDSAIETLNTLTCEAGKGSYTQSPLPSVLDEEISQNSEVGLTFPDRRLSGTSPHQEMALSSLLCYWS